MTWSLVARDPASGALGVAVASRFFAVGAICPFVAGGALALSTQALGYPPHGPAALAHHQAGLHPEAILNAVLSVDTERNQRQVHLIDGDGRIAAHTGERCQGWAGTVRGDNVSVAGNLLAGPSVIENALAAYSGAAKQPFTERLLVGLEGGQQAGGDRRGQQAAALLIQLRNGLRIVDLRVDNDTDAVGALRQLHQAAVGDYYAYMRTFAPPADFESVFGQFESIWRP